VEPKHIETEFGVTIMTIYYEIRVAGAVPPGALRGFEHLAADQPTETVVRGPLPDQAALNGLLVRLETSGVQVIGVRRQQRRSARRPHWADPDE
jgi:hypothetical protein